jgi:methylenetetrahydrofolate reductase (NADPH)
MKQGKNNLSILVVSKSPELAEIIRRAADKPIEVAHASNESEGLDQVKERHPDIIILGYLGPPEVVTKYYNQLREGWISRHSSLLVVGLNIQDTSPCILDDEDLKAGTGKCVFLEGDTGPLLQVEQLIPQLKEAILKKLQQRSNKLKSALTNPDKFCLIWEQIPGPGAFEIRQATVLENAQKAAKGGKFCAISITDNPGGNPAISTDVLCSEIRKLGIEPLVHTAFRDRSRNQVESSLFQLAAMDINNILVLTGDYPSNLGFRGRSKPVFDLDSVNGLRLVGEMNLGLEREIMRRKTRLAPTEFYAGVAFSPFKQEEAEVMWQYHKLKKKIDAGADFIITQVGFDARKLHEFQLWLKKNCYRIPTFGSVYVLSYPTARAMYDNHVPGCVVTEKLLKEIAAESESPDKGRAARLERAAKLYAIVKGTGYRGAYISGQGLSYESTDYIINRGNELTSKWQDLLPEFDYPQKNSFYYFNKDTTNGLNLEDPSPKLEKSARSLIYYLSLALHITIFEPKSPFFKPMRWLIRLIDSTPVLIKPFHSVEFWSKAVLYGCKDCGDCALNDVAYLCPVSQCPKNQRNGPCGGSFEGWCEVYPNQKKCIWVTAYRRMKGRHQEDSITDNLVPPENWELWQTSSWLNYFQGRDHISQRIGLKPPTSNTRPPA